MKQRNDKNAGPRRDSQKSSGNDQLESTDSSQPEPLKQIPSETDPPHDSNDPQRRILPYNFEYYSRSFRELAMSLPHLHRPTQEDFLRVASGFWQRLRIRFKWFTIKSFRKFNADDISGIVTWILMSQTIWILAGT